MPLRHTEGEIAVVESAGQRPVLYLIGPAEPPFDGLPGNGPVLATLAQGNPNAAGDARLWARAGRMKQLIAEAVDFWTRRPSLATGSLMAKAVELLAELDG